MAITKHNRYEVRSWESISEPSFWAFVYVGGNLQAAEMVCRKACFPQGLCVTIEPVKYIFAGGTEDGVRVGLIQYPRFPKSTERLSEQAAKLGIELAEANAQWSFTIVTPTTNTFYSRGKK